MAPDPSATLSALPAFFDALPKVFMVMEAVVYIFLIPFFGSLAMKGCLKYLSPPVKLLGMAGSGAICLLGGLGLSASFPLFPGGVFQLFRVNMMVWGLVLAAVFALGLYFLTKRPGLAGKDVMSKIASLEVEIAKLKALAVKENSEAKKAQETAREIFRDPAKVGGIIIMAAVLAVALLTFRGFPSMGNEFMDYFGMSADDLKGLSGGDMPAGCVGVAELAQAISSGEAPRLLMAENESVCSLMKIESGMPFCYLAKTTYSGTEYFYGFLLSQAATQQELQNGPAGGYRCAATASMVCNCIKV